LLFTTLRVVFDSVRVQKLAGTLRSSAHTSNIDIQNTYGRLFDIFVIYSQTSIDCYPNLRKWTIISCTH